MMARLAAALGEGFLAGVLAGTLLVLFYNHVLATLRESKLKKAIALGILPGACLAGLGHAMAVFLQLPVLREAALPGALCLLLKARSFYLQVRNNRGTRHERLRVGAGLRREHYSRPVWRLLRLLRRVNQADRPELVSDTISGVLPAGSKPVTVAFLTDFHVHGTHREAWYRAIVEEVLRRGPDVVLLGGDFISRPWNARRAERVLAPLRGHPCVLAVRGNHDFWTRPRFFAGMLRRLGVQHLRNDVQSLPGGLAVLGLEHPWVPVTQARQGELRRAVQQYRAEGRFVLGLVHSPEQYPLAAGLGARFLIAGHTHGGQVRIPFFGTTLAGCPVAEQHAHGRGHLGAVPTWTSNGIGAFYPLRIACPPQVVWLRFTD